MNIDKIEILNKFPSLYEYIKLELIDFGVYFLLVFFLFYVLSISFIIAIITFLIYIYFLFKIDKKIFFAFQKRKNYNH